DLADQGTLFLDEIGEIPMHIQAKLLQAIQERCFLPVGGRSYHQVTARILSSTNCNLAEAVKKGKFRSDLYYRLNVIEIEMPPLREREGDISALAKFFLDRFNEQYKTYHSLDPAGMELLEQYAWPGNIRQLQNFIERLVLMVKEERILPSHFPSSIHQDGIPVATLAIDRPLEQVDSLANSLAQIEKKRILEAMARYGSSRKVAEALDISQSKASRLIRKYRQTE
ncbi:MAG: sigma 54-interacting transcriptional regulator, partial [Clostridiales bacterium]